MRKNESKNTDLAGRMYEASDYKRSDELSNGLAVTHEQVSDVYAVGEAGGVSERNAEENSEQDHEDTSK
jgi:hypothetical protein